MKRSRWLDRGRGRGNKTVEEIASYVDAGHAQNASNCRVLLEEIVRLRKANEALQDQVLALLNGQIERL